MTAACLHCAVRNQPGGVWRATGRFITKRLYRPFIAAELQCLRVGCERVWASGLPDAVAAGQKARAEQGLEPYVVNVSDHAAFSQATESSTVRVPAPSLFGAQPSRGAGFVKAGVLVGGRKAKDIVQAFIGVDVKRQASGENE